MSTTNDAATEISGQLQEIDGTLTRIWRDTFDRRERVATMMYPACFHLMTDPTDQEAARRAVEMADALIAELDPKKE